MECSKCDELAVVRQAYSGLHLCETHLYESVESRVKSRIREDNLLGGNGKETWVVGLSGGKDSSVLLYILARVFDENPNVEIVALTLDEGIEGYRNEAVEASCELTDELGVRHEIVEFEDEFGVTMDGVVEQEPEQKPCSYCGVFRRTSLNTHAERLGATKLMMGHNLDDVAQTALMNFLDGDVERMSRHYRASLSPKDEEGDFVRRAKPLRDVPEKEVAIYAQLKDLPTYLEECPNAEGATRGDIRDLLLEYERRHPGTRHSIMSAYEKLAQQLDWESADVSPCDECGEPTTGELCRTCALLSEVA
ncbi:MAG: TIGR00269 family protein [Halobacteria archaeon]|nr:TIGR00269 family protein [Halobacteria archaeon]